MLESDWLRRAGLFGDIVTLANSALIVLDLDGRITAWSVGAQALLGYASREIVGAHVRELYPSGARAAGTAEGELAAVMADGHFETDTAERRHRDGRTLRVHVITTALVDDAGEVVGFGNVLGEPHGRDVEPGTALAAAIDDLDRASSTDFVTGLPNVRAIAVRVAAEIASARRHGTPLVIARLNVDQFTAYNREHGHLAGDRILRAAATIWRRSIRTEDFLARQSGGSLTAILPFCDGPSAVVLLDRMRLATPAPITVSIGVAQYRSDETAQRWIERAVEALEIARAETNTTVFAA